MKVNLYSYDYNSDTRVLTIYGNIDGAETVVCTIPEVEIDEADIIFEEFIETF